MTFAAIVVAGYLLGSCPWGYWLVRVFHGEDIRNHGSGSIGASNVWRAYGPRLGLTVVALDVAQGVRARVRRCASPSRPLRDPRRRGRDGRATRGRSSCASRRAGRWSRPAGGVVIAVAPLVALRSARALDRDVRALPLRRRSPRSSPRSRCRSSAYALGYADVVIAFVRARRRRDRLCCTARTCAGCGPAPRTGSACAAQRA